MAGPAKAGSTGGWAHTCRAGECSACRIRLLSGRVFQPTYTGLRESDRQHGYIHACVSYPLTDLRIRI